MRKTILVLSAVVLGGLVGSASAGQPTVLTDAQLGGVTAGSVGDVQGNRPGFTDLVGRAKGGETIAIQGQPLEVISDLSKAAAGKAVDAVLNSITDSL